MSTYTYVSYYSDDDLGVALVREGYEKLCEDRDSRKAYIDPRALEAMNCRLESLRCTIELLTEPIPKPFGG